MTTQEKRSVYLNFKNWWKFNSFICYIFMSLWYETAWFQIWSAPEQVLRWNEEKKKEKISQIKVILPYRWINLDRSKVFQVIPQSLVAAGEKKVLWKGRWRREKKKLFLKDFKINFLSLSFGNLYGRTSEITGWSSNKKYRP